METGRFELGDRLTVYAFGTPDREETCQWLAYVRSYAMDEDYALQIDRLREKLYAMTDSEYSAFFTRLRVEIGCLIQAARACMWSAAFYMGEETGEINSSNERNASNDRNKSNGNPCGFGQRDWPFRFVNADNEERAHDLLDRDPLQ